MMDIEIKSRPFSREELAKIKRGLKDGKIRRFGAIVSHYKLGFNHNALVAWAKKDISPALAGKLKAKEYISHIYLRRFHRLWPYGLYTMIHARSEGELASFIDQLSALMNGRGHKILNTVKEFKKTSFTPECNRSVIGGVSLRANGVSEPLPTEIAPSPSAPRNDRA